MIDRLLNDPLLSRCDAAVLAKLLPSLERRRLAAGEVLCEAGDGADALFLLVAGRLQVSGTGQVVTIEEGYVGQEAAIGAARYLSRVTAETAAELIAIPRGALQKLFDQHPELVQRLHFSLTNRFTDSLLEPLPEPESRPASSWGEFSQVIGWASAIAAPSLLLWFGRDLGASHEQTLFLAVFASTTVMWMFSLVPVFLPAVFALLFIEVLGIVPSNVILSGFSSSSFFLAMSVFALGIVLVGSGLTYRLALWVLRRAPANGFGYLMVALGLGLFLSPILPSIGGRVALVGPILVDMIDSLGFRRQGSAANRLVLFGLAGASQFSNSFLTANTRNLILFGLLSLQVQGQFEWLNWLLAASLPGLFMLGGCVALGLLWPRVEPPAGEVRRQAREQLHVIGAMSAKEWISLAGIGLFLFGVMTSSVHKINPAWIGLALLFSFFTLGLLSQKGFREQVDWPFLVLVGGLVGLAKAMAWLGVDRLVTAHLSWVGAWLQGDFAVFVLMLAGVVWLLRLVLPSDLSLILTATLFLPLAEAHGINTWVVGFCILMLGDAWFFPYQAPQYLLLQGINRREGLYRESVILLANVYLNGLRLGALLVAIPFWRSLGIL